MGDPEKLPAEPESPERERIGEILESDESSESKQLSYLIPPHDYREPEMFPQFEVKQVSPLPPTAPKDVRMGYSFEMEHDARAYIEWLTEQGFKGTLHLYRWNSGTASGVKRGGDEEEIVIV